MALDIKWVGCAPGNFAHGRPAGFKPEAIVIHVMDGSFVGTRSWFSDPHATVSAHYGVSESGAIDQYVKETDTAFHAGTVVGPTWGLLKPNVNPNFYTIGIEHEGRGSGPAWPAQQMQASAELVAQIAKRWVIPIDEAHVVPHHAIRANKTCPGSGVVLADLIAQASAVPPGLPPTTVAANPGTVTVLAQANVRLLPTTQSGNVRVLVKGTQLTPAAVVKGETLQGNPLWFQLAAGEFLWAGATDHPAV